MLERAQKRAQKEFKRAHLKRKAECNDLQTSDGIRKRVKIMDKKLIC